jgi:hypothetical protein
MEDNVGLVDLLLHPQDRAYTVPQIYEWTEQARLQVLGWMPRPAYNPERLTRDPDLRAAFAGLSPRDRATVAELLRGSTRRHFFTAAHPDFEHEPLTVDHGDWGTVVPVLDPFTRIVTASEVNAQSDTSAPRLVYSYGDLTMGRVLHSWQAALVGIVRQELPMRAICAHKLMRQQLSTHTYDKRERMVRDFVSGASGDGFIHLTR